MSSEEEEEEEEEEENSLASATMSAKTAPISFVYLYLEARLLEGSLSSEEEEEEEMKSPGFVLAALAFHSRSISDDEAWVEEDFFLAWGWEAGGEEG